MARAVTVSWLCLRQGDGLRPGLKEEIYNLGLTAPGHRPVARAAIDGGVCGQYVDKVTERKF